MLHIFHLLKYMHSKNYNTIKFHICVYIPFGSFTISNTSITHTITPPLRCHWDRGLPKNGPAGSHQQPVHNEGQNASGVWGFCTTFPPRHLGGKNLAFKLSWFGIANIIWPTHVLNLRRIMCYHLCCRWWSFTNSSHDFERISFTKSSPIVSPTGWVSGQVWVETRLFFAKSLIIPMI